ncbi:chorismate mutase [Motilimonas sp. E26]|uniref:chorismate mutase n=1 Tax=Motilimonas sp. E26 TaxID=2865674 RepID=UPI001E4BD605|nr:chorismate mutase [Motilimonas sp. E26]MCE0555984.1 chorismate mutase [Motilimonas sp. E26]
MASLDLEEIRRTITELDSDLLTLLAKRKAIALDVARSKQANPRPVRDQEREQALLERLIIQGKDLGLDAHYITEIYHTILEDSVRSQQVYLQQLVNPEHSLPQIKLAFVAETESLFAGIKYINRQGKTLVQWPCKHFQQAIQEVEQGCADCAILPIENTSAGSINEVYDLLQHTRLSIVGEIVVNTEYALYANRELPITQIDTLYCTPQVAQQSSHFIQQLDNINIVYTLTSAQAAEQVKNNAHAAVICNIEEEFCTELVNIKNHITNQQENLSRFILVARKAINVTSQIPAKTTLVLATGQTAGALLNVLSVFKKYNLIMTKLESRPIQGNPWEEMFYIDLAANLDSPAMSQALAEITPQTQYLKVLGCYPSNEVKATQVPGAQLAEIHHSAELVTPVPDNESHSAALSRLNQKFNLIACATVINEDDFANQAQQLKNAGAQAILINQDTTHSNQNQQGLWQACQQRAKALNILLILPVHQLHELNNAAKYADLLYVAGDQMHNSELLEQLGRQHRPVILVRGKTANNDNWLSCATTIMEQGNQQVLLCEQGQYQGEHTQLNLMQTCRLKAHTSLPILVHAFGDITDNEFLLFNKDLYALGLNGSIIDTKPNESTQLQRLGALSKQVNNLKKHNE